VRLDDVTWFVLVLKLKYILVIIVMCILLYAERPMLASVEHYHVGKFFHTWSTLFRLFRA